MAGFEFPRIDRRRFTAGSLAGAAALVAPSALSRSSPAGFTHGVASGEPGPHSVLLWTRFVGSGDEPLQVEVAEDAAFQRVAARADAVAAPARDHCAKVTVSGLAPARWYYYRFLRGGLSSPVGRTRTLPIGRTDRFRMAVFSCSNIGFGWFNAYAHAAEDGAFDAVVHLGDYYYEYERGEYPREKEALLPRIAGLGGETVALADYRARHALYRADPDLQRLFQLYPWIMVWDDHESANDSWKGGAENHEPATEGPWPERVRASLRAYREWLPVSDEPWAAYQAGDLATLYRLESRLTARDKQADYAALLGDAPAGEWPERLRAFRAGAWRDPARTLLGAAQERWLSGGLAASRTAGTTWQVLLQQIVMGELHLPGSLAAGLPADTAPDYRRRIAQRVAASDAGLPFNLDAWDGYPAARERLLGAAHGAGANLVVLAGDSHNAWASDLRHRGAAAGVEFAGHSVTSPGFERSIGWVAPDRLADAIRKASPGLAWCDTAGRGYMAVELTPARATCEWRFLDTIRERSTRLSGTKRLYAERGRNRLIAA